MEREAVIVGAGLAGLCCARHLERHGVDCTVLDAADAPGGRVRTDLVDGFQLDRGFQVLLTSYPEVRAELDLPALRLRPFFPGAAVWRQGALHTLADPWRRPVAGVRSLASPVGSVADKLRIGRLRTAALAGTLDDLWRRPETTTLVALRGHGLSDEMIDSFFRPFLGGIFLDSSLSTSSRMLEFVFRMFAQGDACLPAEGMAAIPRQLAAGLRGEVRCGTRVAAVGPEQVTLSDGSVLAAGAVVLAVEGAAANRLLEEDVATPGQGVTCCYFQAPEPPLHEAMLVLNGEDGPLNNLCVLTTVAPSYGPPGTALISATVLGNRDDHDVLLTEVRQQLADWFGRSAHDWRHLRTYSIPYALPAQPAGALSPASRPVRHPSGLYLCGDHREQASIQGAMVSGRRAAEAVLADLS